MKKIIVTKDFWEIFPTAQIQVVIAKGLNNQVVDEKYDDFKNMLAEAVKESQKFLTADVFSQNEVIALWREAFSQFKTKKGARSSIEALLKRASQGREFEPINPLVDIYNSISLEFAVPAGGEDLEAIDGDLILGKAQGGESFFPLGADKDAPALPEEIIYYDQTGAVCRCLNWREAQRTMLLEKTTDAVLVLESINQEQAERANQAVQELKKKIDSYFSIDSQIITLTAGNPSATLIE
ncbi:hypothetical protein KUA55_15165 [Enterococcus sp. ALS3]|uniref:B3/B4 tRNA-binding domain-containing protein n=1 Tax=Enterococcus alishanensis TaxID=1303817 RepID=A0ABS6TGJ5_9ENTE|nr:phenylalanine--tRNA ligase beta subunit-related protein [Enterococcus alishanensis]MBV7392020.1 hypothetical protein [Enterococcus alishanensis]